MINGLQSIFGFIYIYINTHIYIPVFIQCLLPLAQNPGISPFEVNETQKIYLFSSCLVAAVSVHRGIIIPFLMQLQCSVGYCSKMQTSTLGKTAFAPSVSFFHSALAEEIDAKQLTKISPNSPQTHTEHSTMPTFIFSSHGSIRDDPLCIQSSTMENDFQSINLEPLRLGCSQNYPFVLKGF